MKNSISYIEKYNSPLGPMTMSSDGESLIGLWFDGQKYALAGLGKKVVSGEKLSIFDETKKWLNMYFSGKRPDFTPKLNPGGSDFRRMIADLMLKIPYGETRSYGELADQAAKLMGKERMSAQAVGGAVGHNRISVIIPCHRVVGSDGSLTGYAGGIEKKVRLLETEGIELKAAGLYLPR